MANLWDVTDLDIDRFARGVLDQWLGEASLMLPPMMLLLGHTVTLVGGIPSHVHAMRVLQCLLHDSRSDLVSAAVTRSDGGC